MVTTYSCKRCYGARRILSVIMILVFMSGQTGLAGAASAGGLGTPLPIMRSVAGFQPPVLLGMKIHPENPLLFDFIVDQGAVKLSEKDLKSETEKLVKYFFAALTIPDQEAWVNLSPTEKDRIIPDVLGRTTMGKTMLEQDYALKQLAASLTHPDTELGKKYWEKVGTVPAFKGTVPTFSPTFLSKVWIVPAKAKVIESNGIVLVEEKRLKVLMAEEYENNTSSLHSMSFPRKRESIYNPRMDPRLRGDDRIANQAPGIDHQEPSTEVFRSLILPQIDQQVNESKDFAYVRQVYNSVILAAWYKQALRESLLGKIYVNKEKVAGVVIEDKTMKQRIYDQYLAVLKKGVYNLIKEEEDPATGEMVPKKYFSGGELLALNQAGSTPLEISPATGAKSREIFDRAGSTVLASVYAATETGDRKAVMTSVEKRTENTPSSLASSPIRFLFHSYKDFQQHLARLNEQIHAADIIFYEEYPGLIDTANAVAMGAMTPEVGYDGFLAIAQQNGIKFLVPEMKRVMLKAIYKSNKRIFGEDSAAQKTLMYRDQARESWNEFFGEFVNADGAKAYQWYKQYLQQYGRYYYERERVTYDKIKDIRTNHPEQKLLVILGDVHSNGAAYFKNQFPGIELNDENLGAQPDYPLNEILKHRISAKAFGLTQEPLPGSETISAIVSELLTLQPGRYHWPAVNAIASRVTTMQQLNSLARFMHDHPPDPSLAKGHSEWPEQVQFQTVAQNVSDWLVLEKIATREQMVKITSSAILPVERILDFLRWKKHPVDDLLVLGNDHLDTFREALVYLQYDIVKRIYIAGGYGRLTLLLIDRAVAAGFKIAISEDQVVDLGSWPQLRKGKSDTDLKALLKVSEAQIIRQIMIQMLNNEKEFENLRKKIGSKTLAQLIIVESPEPNPEHNSKYTYENYTLYKKFLENEGKFQPDSRPITVLYIQYPHQQFRSMGMFEEVFRQEIKDGKIKGISNTVVYPSGGKSMEEIIKEIDGEMWKILVNLKRGDLHLPSDEFPQNLGSLPAHIWSDAENLLSQLSGEQRQIFAAGLVRFSEELKVTRDQLLQEIPPEVNAFVQAIFEAARVSSQVAADAGRSEPYGGIDFDASKLNLQIKRDDHGVPLPLPQQNLEQINIEGLFPVIINIVPVTTQNLPIFLGQVSPGEQEKQGIEKVQKLSKSSFPRPEPWDQRGDRKQYPASMRRIQNGIPFNLA